MKHSFYDDYSEGAHLEILKAISENNSVQQLGYGNDEYCQLAIDRIKAAFGCPDSDVHFIPGGTAANVIGLTSMLRPYEGIISPQSGHINVHEAGAVEATGHKVIPFHSEDGKLKVDNIQQALDEYEDEHTVKPKVVYLTQSTELGTIYSLAELQAIVNFSKQNNLYTFLDGARLAMAVTAKNSTAPIKDIGNLGLDMFYIGGTKNGGLYGEAIVINNKELKTDFRSYIKRQGALMAKGRFMGQQFARFFTDDNLWLSLGSKANETAQYLYEGLLKRSIRFNTACETNQVFPILENSMIDNLEKEYGFYRWSKIDENYTKIRLVCSFATEKTAVDSFLNSLDKHL